MNKRTLKATDKTVVAKSLVVSNLKLRFEKEQIAERSALFDTFLAANQQTLAALDKPDIEITLPNGAIVKGQALVTTAMDVALGISKSLAKRVVAARVEYANKVQGPFGAVIDCDEAHDEDQDADEDSDNEIVNEFMEAKKARGIVVDLTAPLLGSCKLELIGFDDPQGKEVFWHSSAHILGSSLEHNFGAFLTHGPPLDEGFFYDSFQGDHKLTPSDYAKLEETAKELVKKRYPFEKVYLTRDEALQLFKNNPFKVALITSKIEPGTMTTAYRCGDLVDLCTGPHLPDTGRVNAFKVTKNSAAYWLGNQDNDSLQRVYAITFPDRKDLKKWLKVQKDLADKDHRHIGEQQKLFHFNQASPGCPFFMKHGTRIFNRLVDLMRHEYFYRGFQEVNTPTMFKSDLWKTSGHYFKYKEDMFFLESEGEEYGIKPMNCPSHCVIFAADLKSYRDLPIRMADFGVLHRNEDSGALTGLTRVRKFHQDDAHIFCRQDQIQQEIIAQMKFLKYVYDLLGLTYRFELSTRPKNYVGDKKMWRDAEKQLKQVLDKVYPEWVLNKGDGAFYGPKIDIQVTDVYNRKHQLATIQLDFNLPIRFNLQYKADENEEKAKINTEGELVPASSIVETEKKDELEGQDKFGEEGFKVGGKLKTGFKRPLMIHRAILGSLERCIAILCEHFGGKWPFWLSPRQIAVLPVSDKFMDYANQVEKSLSLAGYYVDVSTLNASLNKKIRVAQMSQYNFILVVGEKEEENGTVNVRIRDQKKPRGTETIAEFLQHLEGLKPPKSDAQLEFEAGTVQAASTEDTQISELNQRLKLRVYLSGDGLAKGAEDDEALKKIEGVDVDAEKYPNVARWKRFLEKTKA